MLDHASLGVSDIERSRRFYDAALRPLCQPPQAPMVVAGW